MEAVGKTWDNLQLDIVDVYECEECGWRTTWKNMSCARCLKELKEEKWAVCGNY